MFAGVHDQHDGEILDRQTSERLTVHTLDVTSPDSIKVNVVGQVAVTQAFLPMMRRGTGARIVFVGSVGGRSRRVFDRLARRMTTGPGRTTSGNPWRLDMTDLVCAWAPVRAPR